jgi:hypothetical protein
VYGCVVGRANCYDSSILSGNGMGTKLEISLNKINNFAKFKNFYPLRAQASGDPKDLKH